MAAKIRPCLFCCVLLSRISEVHNRASKARGTTACQGVTSCLIPDLAESSSLVSQQYVSAPQKTPRTPNTCGNKFVLPRAMIVPKQFLWLKLLHTSYLSPLNQVQKNRVLYSVDKHFETKGDSRNFCNKQLLKCGRHVCRHFRVEFWELTPSHVFRNQFARSKKTKGATLSHKTV